MWVSLWQRRVRLFDDRLLHRVFEIALGLAMGLLQHQHGSQFLGRV